MEQAIVSMHLSKREQQVVELLSQGFTVKEASAQLFISYNTADTHRKRAIEKLGARNLPHAVRLAMQLGLC